jgi:multicomponent Na+:H+ antiporter subunit B
MMVPAGVAIFAGVGVVNLLLGDNYLDYSSLMHDPANGQHIGILLVEIGVFVTVSGTMVAIFYTFVGRGR